MKQKKELLHILNCRHRQLKKCNSIEKLKTSFSIGQIRVRTQQSISPKRNLEMTMPLQPRRQLTISLQFQNKNIPLIISITQTTDELRSIAQKYYPQITQLITINQDLVIDYWLTLKDKYLDFFSNKNILILTAFIGQPKKNRQASMRDYLLIKCIGVGGFSRVYLAKSKEDGCFYAIKIIDKNSIKQKGIENIIENERNILAVTNHAFLNKMYYSFECAHYLVFVNQLCAGGDLLHYLTKYKILTENQARFYLTEFILGLLYLHQLDILYRDIKPENILIDLDGHVQIADFGLAKPNSVDQAYSFCGSPDYMAPEMLKNEGHNQQLDHYCLGVLLYEMLVGVPPFYNRDIKQIYQDVLKKQVQLPKDKHFSTEVKDLISQLMQKDVTKRLGYRGGLLEILDHPWFADIDILGLLGRKIQPPFRPDAHKLPPFFKNHKDGDLEVIKKLTDKSTYQPMFSNFYYDQLQEVDLKLEQCKFNRYYLQMVEQQQGKLNRRKKQKLLKKMILKENV